LSVFWWPHKIGDMEVIDKVQKSACFSHIDSINLVYLHKLHIGRWDASTSKRRGRASGGGVVPAAAGHACIVVAYRL